MFSILKKIYTFLFNCRIFRLIITEIQYIYEGTRAVAEDIKFKKNNKCDLLDLSGRNIVVTGGSRGIGSEVVRRFLQSNAHVIIGCRNTEAGYNTVSKIRKSGILSGTSAIFHLDLNSFSSVKKFATQITNTYDKLHILVNNAGIMFPGYKLTDDGFESQWQVNYLAPFLLTHLLCDIIYKTSLDSECRIINVSSCAHNLSKEIQYSSVKSESQFITGIAYANSKAAQICFSLWLSKLFKDKDINISVFAVHPGIVDTDLFNGTPVKVLAPWLCKNVFKSVEEGGTSVLYACVSPNLSGLTGLYLSNCMATTPSEFTQDPSKQKELFQYSLETLKIKEFGFKD